MLLRESAANRPSPERCVSYSCC